jgi:hypothetical protein
VSITTRSPRPPADVAWTDHRIAGTPAQVAAVVNRTTTTGQLVFMSAPVRLDNGDVTVHLRLRRTAPATHLRHTGRHPHQTTRPTALTPARHDIAKAATAAIAVTTTGALLVALTVSWLTHALAWLLPTAIGLVITVGLLWLLSTTRTAHHCPGCRH